MITIQPYQLYNLFKEASRQGAIEYDRLRQSRKPRQDAAADRLSQREAYRLFGRPRVVRWQQDGAVRAVRLGSGANSKLAYSYAELMAQEAAESRALRSLLAPPPPDAAPAEQEQAQERLRFYALLLADGLPGAGSVQVVEAYRQERDGEAAECHVTAHVDGCDYHNTAPSFGEALAEISAAHKKIQQKIQQKIQ